MQATTSQFRFLDPAVLSKIASLELVARTVVEGFVSGLHQSPYLGFSVDFAEYRQYMPGDDIRRIDWKVYARSDRYYMKEYEGETNTNVYLLLDISASMGYKSGPLSKMEYASYLAACLAYFAQQQKDSVGLVTFDENLVEKLPARCRLGHISSILHILDRVNPTASTEFRKPLMALAETFHRRGIVVLISDLYAPAADIIRSLRQFRFRGNDMVVFHVLDPQEKEFKFSRSFRLEDMETKREILMVPEEARENYLAQLSAHIETIKKECGALGIDYLQLDTSRPLDYALYTYLVTRRKSM
ncbi:MAG: DUF58 domain-containing protein [Acidimicrobiia bacterium]|nr:DUF58 domain-containing protein [Acidimicrobiia bacterium]